MLHKEISHNRKNQASYFVIASEAALRPVVEKYNGKFSGELSVPKEEHLMARLEVAQESLTPV